LNLVIGMTFSNKIAKVSTGHWKLP